MEFPHATKRSIGIFTLLSTSSAFTRPSFVYNTCGILSKVASFRRDEITTIAIAAKPTKWDNLVDEDEDDDEEDDFSPRIPPDMTYIPRNVKRQHEHFWSIRQVGGKEMTNDVYVREPGEETFWYTGKVARVTDVTLEQAVARQWPLIEQHAANLRPIELFPSRGRLEVWTAPGDSELEVAYNRPTLQMKKMEKNVDGADTVKNSLIGFQGEVYQKGEEGFRSWRTEDGFPARPEINPGGENRPPTDEEMAQLQRELEGKDINEIYEEQERRKAEGTY